MRIRVLSDLHLEGRDWTYKPHGEDLVVLAGDICSRTKDGRDRRDRLLRHIAVPVVYVLGNHEFYGGYLSRQMTTDLIRGELRQFPHVTLLDDQAEIIDGVRFVGATLWSDFHLPHPRVTREAIMDALPRAINDFGYIAGPTGDMLVAKDMAEWAMASKRFLAGQIASSTDRTVVVTHFLPSALSISKRYHEQPLNAYFCCPVDEMIRHPVVAWIHGHTHDACQYELNGVRVVCNPRGYPGDVSGYDSDLMVDA